jgi:hypothetical protein
MENDTISSFSIPDIESKSVSNLGYLVAAGVRLMDWYEDMLNLLSSTSDDELERCEEEYWNFLRDHPESNNLTQSSRLCELFQHVHQLHPQEYRNKSSLQAMWTL